MLNMTPDGDMQESKELELTNKAALQPTIDQCIDALLTGLVAREPDVVEGARVCVSYSMDSEGKMKVDSTRRKYFKPHEHLFTVPVQDLSWVNARLLYTALLDASDSEKNEVMGKMHDLSDVFSDDDPKSLAMQERLQRVLAAVSTYDKGSLEKGGASAATKDALMTSVQDFLVAFKTDDLEMFVLEKVLQKTVERIIAGNLKSTSHPELEKFTERDRNGVTNLNDAGREKFYELSGTLVQNLMRKLEEFPMIKSGGLVRTRCKIEDSGAVRDVALRYVTLDPTYPMGIREHLPETTDMQSPERGDACEHEARKQAYNVIKGNMDVAKSPHRHRYFSKPSTDFSNPAKGFYEALMEFIRTMTVHFSDESPFENGILAKIYDKVTDKITEGMLSLEERRPLPFFLSVKADEPDKDGEQSVSLDKANKVYLNSQMPGGFRVDVKPQPKKNLCEEDLRHVAESAVNAAITRVIVPHMTGANHALNDYCFEKPADSKKPPYLNEQGAKELEGIIISLAEKFSIALLQMRARVPEHFSGYRALLAYEFKSDDSFRSLELSQEYFSPAKESLKFLLPDKRKMLASVPEEQRESVLREDYETFARNFLTGLLAAKMGGHPAQKEYFQPGEDRRLQLTETGRTVLGRMIHHNSKSFAEQMMESAGNGRGGNFQVDYDIAPDKMNYVKVRRIWVG
jgi:hypothetical protein